MPAPHATAIRTAYDRGDLERAYAPLGRYGDRAARVDLRAGETVVIYRYAGRRWGITLTRQEVTAMEWEPLQ
jgi:hypothetical protein